MILTKMKIFFLWKADINIAFGLISKVCTIFSFFHMCIIAIMLYRRAIVVLSDRFAQSHINMFQTFLIYCKIPKYFLAPGLELLGLQKYDLKALK